MLVGAKRGRCSPNRHRPRHNCCAPPNVIKPELNRGQPYVALSRLGVTINNLGNSRLTAPMAKVFISYSHDSDLHKQRIQELADQLRTRGAQVLIDQDMLPGGPEQGWNPLIPCTNSRRLDARSSFVCTRTLIVPSFEGRETEGVGLGAVAEARLIQQFLDNAGGNNPRFRVVVFDPHRRPTRIRSPDTLRTTHHRFRVYKSAKRSGLAELIALAY